LNTFCGVYFWYLTNISTLPHIRAFYSEANMVPREIGFARSKLIDLE